MAPTQAPIPPVRLHRGGMGRALVRDLAVVDAEQDKLQRAGLHEAREKIALGMRDAARALEELREADQLLLALADASL